MTLDIFSSLNSKVQQEIVLAFGIFLFERKLTCFRAMLYQLGDFYVELFFYQTSNKVFWLKAFSSTDELQPYLEEIDLSPVLQKVLS
ncbi:MAG: hypothetical protein ICV66_11755 [Chitinophagaceae bacterium]|nr:hypothetical protein [Chitinophagaceae bacterium]